MKRIISTFVILSGCYLISSGSSFAQTNTAQFDVKITITSSCQINSATTLDFGSSGVLSVDRDAGSAVTVQCTNTTPYNIGLNSGIGTGATVGNRIMTGPGNATIGYSLYKTAARTTVWGNTVGTDTVSGVGNGLAQAYPVYGRVPAQATPAAGTYTDTVTATITY